MPQHSTCLLPVFALILLFINSANSAACPSPISTPGVYILGTDYEGAPNPLTTQYGNGCIHVISSNVIIDCNNHKLNGSTAPSNKPSFGIYVDNGVSNVTIRNCNVVNYSYGIYAAVASDVLISKNTINSQVLSIGVDGCSDTTVHNNTAYSGIYGFYFSYGDGNKAYNNTAIGNFYGFLFDGAGKMDVNLIRAHNNSYTGLQIEGGSSQNNFSNVHIYGSKKYGVYVYFSYNNILKNISIITDSNANGTYIEGGSGNVFDCGGGEIVGSNSREAYGIHSFDSPYTTIKNCVIKRFLTGVYLNGLSTKSLIENNTITGALGINGSNGVLSDGEEGGSVYGIRVNTINVNITKNIISNLYGGRGGNGSSNIFSYGYNGGNGGNSYGIYMDTCDGSNISENQISGIRGGDGGNGGFSNYDFGGRGGDGGLAAAVYLVDGDNARFYSNNIYNITGGKGGRGGDTDLGPNGGLGGTGGDAAGIYTSGNLMEGHNYSLNIFRDLSGGTGGDGGDTCIYSGGDTCGEGGVGGAGGNAYAFVLSSWIYSTVDRNRISMVRGGTGGEGGAGSYAGDGGAGGSSLGISLTYSYRAGVGNNNITNISGGIGGNGKVYGTGGEGGEGVGISLNDLDESQVFRNAIANISGGRGGDGTSESWGGNGGRGSGVSISSMSTGLNISYLNISRVYGGEGGSGGTEGYAGTSIGVYLAYNSQTNLSFSDISGVQHGVLIQSPYNVVYNNRIHDSGYGIEVYSFSTKIINNLIYGCQYNGIYFHSASQCLLHNNSLYDNVNGINMLYSDSNNITNSTFANKHIDIQISLSNSNSVSNVIIKPVSTAYYRVFVSSSSISLSNLTVNGGKYGLYSANNALNISNSVIYNNSISALYVKAGTRPKGFYAYNITLDNPLGGLRNYTVIDLADSVTSDDEYSIKWARLNYALPQNYISFRNKLVNITAIKSSSLISSVSFKWSDAETAGYDENKFKLFKHNSSGWLETDAVLDTSLNKLTLANFKPLSDYGILQEKPPVNCPVISTPGTYEMESNYINAPNSASPLTGVACVVISTSNVIFDCNGYNITNNLSTTTYGILLKGPLTNVTVRNCPRIYNYSYGVYLYNSNSSKVSNVSVYSQKIAGFYLHNSSKNILTYNRQDGEMYGYYALGGFYLLESNNNTLSNNTAVNNVNAGFYINKSADNRIINNTARDNYNIGFYVWNSSNTNLSNNVFDNNGVGAYIRYSDNGFVSNNYGLNSINSHSVALDFSKNFIIRDNFFNNNLYGILVQQTNNTRISGNEVYNSTQYGIKLSGTRNLLVDYNNIYNASEGIYFGYSEDGNISFNNIGLCSDSCINVFASFSGSYYQNSISECLNNGFFVVTSNGNFTNNNINGCQNSSFYITYGAGGNYSGNYILNSKVGYYVYESEGIQISGNNILGGTSQALGAIHLQKSQNNLLFRNVLDSNAFAGVSLSGSDNNLLSSNNITGSQYGIYIATSHGNNFSETRLYDNVVNLHIEQDSDGNRFTNTFSYKTSTYLQMGLLNTGNCTFINFTVGDSNGRRIVTWHNLVADYAELSASTFAFSDNFVSLDSISVPALNRSATVQFAIMDCSSFSPKDVIYAPGHHTSRLSIVSAGVSCPSSICSNFVCNAGTLTFNVAHFSGYAFGANANLIISNNGPKYANQTITFTANYSNSSDSTHISGANCILTLFNGTSYLMSEGANLYILSLKVAQPGNHTYNVTCSRAGFTTLTANDTFLINAISNFTNVTLFRANVTDAASLPRWEGSSISLPIYIEGGNVSDLNLSSSTLTDRWAALYGNITNEIYLTSALGGITNYVYRWSWTAANGGVVCASVNTTFLTVSVSGASGADIDVAWGFSGVSDSGSNTFSQLGCNMTISNRNITGSYYADTGFAGGFITCALKTVQIPSKGNMLFCTNVNSTGRAFNGVPANFELIVPTAYGNGQFETYYLYLGLN